MLELDDIQAAYERIRASVYYSPCAYSQTFSKRCDTKAHFKLENLQMTGSFKERGALNRILDLDDTERARGVVAASAGNHAQAVAYHARQAGISATIFMPRRTPLVKIANTRSHGAKVILEGDSFDEAYAAALDLEKSENRVFLHPFDDDAVIAGQGTVAIEIAQQVPDVEVVVVPIGGGGLISGVGIALKALRPEVKIIGVQALAVPSMQRSVASGRRETVHNRDTIADGIAVKRPGEKTLRYVERFVDNIVCVDEEEIANAILLLLEREKTVVEGAGAVTLAAVANGHVPEAIGKRTVMILSGGNIDVNLLSRIIERGLAKDGRLVKIEASIQDEPGALAKLLQQVGEQGVNVIEVHHNRAFNDLGLAEVTVELTLETRGRDHLHRLAEALRESGYALRNLAPATVQAKYEDSESGLADT